MEVFSLSFLKIHAAYDHTYVYINLALAYPSALFKYSFLISLGHFYLLLTLLIQYIPRNMHTVRHLSSFHWDVHWDISLDDSDKINLNLSQWRYLWEYRQKQYMTQLVSTTHSTTQSSEIPCGYFITFTHVNVDCVCSAYIDKSSDNRAKFHRTYWKCNRKILPYMNTKIQIMREQ